MRICHYYQGLSFRLEAGGIVRALLDSCPALAAAGHDLTMLVHDATDIPREWLTPSPGLPHVVQIPQPSIGRRFFSRRDLRRLEPHLKDAEVVHVHGVWAPTNAQVAGAAQRLGVPYVWSLHGMLDEWCMEQRTLKKRLFLSLLARKHLQRAAAVHCTAQAEWDQSRRWIPGARGAVVPLILNVQEYEELPGPDLARAKFAELRSDRPSLLFLSRLHYKKGVELLIDAAGVLRERGVDCQALIAGTGDTGYLEKLKEHVKDAGLGDRVHFLGFVTGAEKVSLYQAADLFVLPTSQENFGFVLFESLAARTPVITTRGVDTWPELEESSGAIITEASPQRLADAIAELLADPERRASMGEAGRRWVLEHLTAKRVVERYAELYRECVEGGRVAAAGQKS